MLYSRPSLCLVHIEHTFDSCRLRLDVNEVLTRGIERSVFTIISTLINKVIFLDPRV